MIAITKRFLLLSPLLVLARRAFGQANAATEPGSAPLARVTANAIDGYILPAYQSLQAATGQLVSAIDGHCATPEGETDPTVRTAFEAVLVAWAKVDFLRFGPIAEQSRLERFSYFPDRHGTGARQLRKILASTDPALLEPGAVAKLSAAVQGLPALESLLLAGTSDKATIAYRCRLSLAIAQNLDAIAGETLVGWTKPDGWKHAMLAPGRSNIVYRDADEPVIEILKAIGTGLLQIRDQRLLPALGTSFAEAKPARGAFVKSGFALAYLAASGDAIESLVDKSELFNLTPDEAPALYADTKAAFAIYRDGIAASPSWADAFATEAGYQHLRSAFDALKTLEDIFNFRFPNAAGISPGFNALDGD